MNNPKTEVDSRGHMVEEKVVLFYTHIRSLKGDVKIQFLWPPIVHTILQKQLPHHVTCGEDSHNGLGGLWGHNYSLYCYLILMTDGANGFFKLATETTEAAHPVLELDPSFWLPYLRIITPQKSNHLAKSMIQQPFKWGFISLGKFCLLFCTYIVYYILPQRSSLVISNRIIFPMLTFNPPSSVRQIAGPIQNQTLHEEFGGYQLVVNFNLWPCL